MLSLRPHQLLILPSLFACMLLLYAPAHAQDEPSNTAATEETSTADNGSELAEEATSTPEAEEQNASGGETDAASNVGVFWPLFAMLLGVAVVLGLMIGLKVHAFIALILGALFQVVQGGFLFHRS